MFPPAHHVDVLMAGFFFAAAISGEVFRRFATRCSGRDAASASCILCTCEEFSAVSVTGAEQHEGGQKEPGKVQMLCQTCTAQTKQE